MGCGLVLGLVFCFVFFYNEMSVTQIVLALSCLLWLLLVEFWRLGAQHD